MNAKKRASTPDDKLMQKAGERRKFSEIDYALLVCANIPRLENFDGMSQNQIAARELESFDPIIHREVWGITTQIRPLSVREWERIVCICNDLDFALYIIQQPYGFAVGIYGRRNIGDPIQILLWLDERDIPLPRSKRGFDGQYEALAALFKKTHTKRNMAMIKQFGLEPLDKDTSYYAYA